MMPAKTIAATSCKPLSTVTRGASSTDTHGAAQEKAPAKNASLTGRNGAAQLILSIHRFNFVADKDWDSSCPEREGTSKSFTSAICIASMCR